MSVSIHNLGHFIPYMAGVSRHGLRGKGWYASLIAPVSDLLYSKVNQQLLSDTKVMAYPKWRFIYSGSSG